jgi:sugar phosphate isomerase/epimerase
MWSRRAFLQHSSLALAALACGGARAAQPKLGPLNRPIGIQLYTVRDAVAKDLAGTLQALSEIGYREVELAGIPTVPAEQYRSLLKEHGLAAPSMHAGMGDLQTSLQQRIDYAAAIGARYLVVSFPWTADSRFSKGGGNALAAGITLDDWKWNAERLNRIGELTKKANIQCGYHNHNMEFRSYDSVVAYDELLRQTDPALVTMQMDIAWVVTAGADPLSYLTRHASRISSLHVKDVRKGAKIAADRIDSQTTEVGSGQVDWPKLFAAMKPEHIRHLFVEQENFDRPPLEAVKISFEYLSRLGDATRKA